MEKYDGKSVCPGFAVGKIKVLNKPETLITKNKVSDSDAEKKRYDKARNEVVNDFNRLYQEAGRMSSKECQSADIFSGYCMILEDAGFNESVYMLIESENMNAEYALSVTGNKYAEVLESTDDEIISGRSIDVRDVTDRVIKVLSGQKDNNLNFDEPVILVTDSLLPSDIIQIGKNKLLGAVLKTCSNKSHTALLADEFGIPVIISTDICQEYDNQLGLIDGYSGHFFINPNEETINCYKEKYSNSNQNSDILEFVGMENITKSGKKVDILANISGITEIESVISNDACGIGLFRSEFTYLKSKDYPTEEELFLLYKSVLDKMKDKKVVIRTFDLGGDKIAPYFDSKKEENPALGKRGARVYVLSPEMFKTQLRALYRASSFGNLSIMYPMITSVKEILEIREISKRVRDELITEGYIIGNIEEGIMIETPAAALISDELAKYADFFSIGTNDLTQYTLALDRQNDELSELYDSKHKAVLKLIEMTVTNGHKEGIRVGICGDLAADTTLTGDFVRMGIDELSVTPKNVLLVRKAVRETE